MFLFVVLTTKTDPEGMTSCKLITVSGCITRAYTRKMAILRNGDIA